MPLSDLKNKWIPEKKSSRSHKASNEAKYFPGKAMPIWQIITMAHSAFLLHLKRQSLKFYLLLVLLQASIHLLRILSSEDLHYKASL